MKILVIGNLASGKSTLCQKIASEHNIKHLSLDECRKNAALKYAHPNQVESAAQKELRLLLNQESFVLESTATGHFWSEILNQYQKSFDAIIRMEADFSTCKRRFGNRQNYMPARHFKSDFEKSFWKIEESLERWGRYFFQQIPRRISFFKTGSEYKAIKYV